MKQKSYWRCKVCLATAVVTESLFRSTVTPQCGGCGGRMEFLGLVKGNRYAREELLSPCDARCTEAQGPNCDCRCRGENHGTGKVVPVTVEAGTIVIGALDPDKCRRRRAELEAAIEAVWDAAAARVGQEALEAFRQGRWVANKAAWWALREVRERIDSALRLKSHKGRLRRLAEAVESV